MPAQNEALLHIKRACRACVDRMNIIGAKGKKRDALALEFVIGYLHSLNDNGCKESFGTWLMVGPCRDGFKAIQKEVE